MLLFLCQLFMMRVCVCVCVCVRTCVRACVRACVCVVVHWHCSAQLSMFNMEKRYRNKIIIIKNRPLTLFCFDCLVVHLQKIW